MTIKDRIKELCKQKNVSMNQLEKELGFGVGYISKLGTTTPNAKKIKIIADYFNVSVDYLMTGRKHELTIEMADIDSELIMLDKKVKQYAPLLSKMEKLDQELIFAMIDRLTK